MRNAIDGLRRQTYRNFEVLIQDGGSTDGTLEYLSSVTDLPKIEIASEPDAGIGQAYNRGIARSKGDLICLIAADEILDDDALEKCLGWLRRHPKAATVYGGMRLVDENDHIASVFIPPPFDVTRFLHNEIFPSTAGLLVRHRIGADLYYDESLKTCPDYDFWIRLGAKFRKDQLVAVPDPIVTARGDRTSMSYRVESFDAFTRDKLFVLNRYLDSLGDRQEVKTLRRTASAGILTWAAEMTYNLVGLTPEFLKWCAEAAKVDAHSERLARVAKRSEAFRITEAGEFEVLPSPQPLSPDGPTQPADGEVSLSRTWVHPGWKGAKFTNGISTRVVTRAEPWSYSAVIPVDCPSAGEAGIWLWAKLTVRVVSGQVGIGLFAADDLFSERLVSAHEGITNVFVRLNQPSPDGLMVRNGSLPGVSTVEILGASIERAPRPPMPAT